MLSPVLVCKYFQIMTITWFTDFQVHSVFAIFSVTDECVQWVRYMISFVCCFFFLFLFFFFFLLFLSKPHTPIVLQSVHFPIVSNSHLINVYRLANMKENTVL